MSSRAVVRAGHERSWRVRQHLLHLRVRAGAGQGGHAVGATATQSPNDTSTAASTRRPVRRRQHLFGEHDRRDDDHPGDAHDADREQDQHQRPAASNAPGAVLDPHPHGTGGPSRQWCTTKLERCAAVAEAGALQRSQLVGACERDRCAGERRTGPVPREERRVDTADQPEERRRRPVRTPSTRSGSRPGTGRWRVRAGPDIAATFEKSSTIGVADGSIIAAIMVTQMPRYQPTEPRSVPGPASMPRIRR